MLAAAISLKASFQTGLSYGYILISISFYTIRTIVSFIGWMLDIITTHPKRKYSIIPRIGGDSNYYTDGSGPRKTNCMDYQYVSRPCTFHSFSRDAKSAPPPRRN